MTQTDAASLHHPLRSDLDDVRLYRGVRTRRIFAFLFDYTLLLVLTAAAYVVVALLGIVTLGLSWLLFGILWPLMAIFYVGLTVGGSEQASPGMRLMGLRLERLDGGRVDPPLAVLHGVLFWAAHSLLTPLLLLVGLVTARKQLLHDLLLGTVVVRDR
ncbi:RDD family protein [Aurantimonas sp. MSK8Z-1]|uniref:RDD family protein n=1 Tax=Mangrovibrevibacter kandeliae TaxID=2968473 RepID=UPI0021178B0A|nr:RDD family protein [Aurantimonas sp. MSK8Z-1]MCW4114199.1 RDD family protein [Aurantimonas sp. MSK8Z-1]